MKISIEMFIDNKWITQIRYYKCEKSLSSFDLYDIPNKRKNAQII
jgi:hypothetical protein